MNFFFLLLSITFKLQFFFLDSPRCRLAHFLSYLGCLFLNEFWAGDTQTIFDIIHHDSANTGWLVLNFNFSLSLSFLLFFWAFHIQFLLLLFIFIKLKNVYNATVFDAWNPIFLSFSLYFTDWCSRRGQLLTKPELPCESIERRKFNYTRANPLHITDTYILTWFFRENLIHKKRKNLK